MLACSWISDGRPPVRILVIRLFRVLCKKLPDYSLYQYKVSIHFDRTLKFQNYIQHQSHEKFSGNFANNYF